MVTVARPGPVALTRAFEFETTSTAAATAAKMSARPAATK
jgi:hypothetical protein